VSESSNVKEQSVGCKERVTGYEGKRASKGAPKPSGRYRKKGIKGGIGRKATSYRKEGRVSMVGSQGFKGFLGCRVEGRFLEDIVRRRPEFQVTIGLVVFTVPHSLWGTMGPVINTANSTRVLPPSSLLATSRTGAGRQTRVG